MRIRAAYEARGRGRGDAAPEALHWGAAVLAEEQRGEGQRSHLGGVPRVGRARQWVWRRSKESKQQRHGVRGERGDLGQREKALLVVSLYVGALRRSAVSGRCLASLHEIADDV